MAQITHEREECIGCGACVAVNPEGWEMGDDGKSDLKGANTDNEGRQHKDAQGEELQAHEEAAQSCPASCIHITQDEER